MLKLTYHNNKQPVHVNVAHIVLMMPHGEGGTLIALSEKGTLHVAQTCDQILSAKAIKLGWL